MKPKGVQKDVRLICLDWNGTLLDDRDLVYGAVEKIFSTYGLPAPTRETYMREIGANYMEFYIRHGIPSPKSPNEMIELKAKLNQIRSAFLLDNWRVPKLATGAKDLLRFSKEMGIKAAIVSGEQPDILLARLAQFKIGHYFSKVIAGASNKDGKETVLRGLPQKFRLAPENCVYVDDSYDGIRSAKLAGMRAIAFLGGYGNRESIGPAEPDRWASTFAEVKDILFP